jgi:hypothetical protein
MILVRMREDGEINFIQFFGLHQVLQGTEYKRVSSMRAQAEINDNPLLVRRMDRYAVPALHIPHGNFTVTIHIMELSFRCQSQQGFSYAAGIEFLRLIDRLK